MADNNIQYEFIDIESDGISADYVTKINNGKRIIPTFNVNGQYYTNPDNEKLVIILDLEIPTDNHIYDVVIIGGGAAGITTSIYAQRDKYDTLILEQKNIGGNAYLTKNIENYPGFKIVSGPELMDRMADQSETLGAKIVTGVHINSVEITNKYFHIKTNTQLYRGRTVVLATGSTYRLLNVPGESELIGSGIHFCATCDGAFYRGKDVIVVGGGNSALEEAMFLAGFCNKVTILSKSETFSATKTYVDKLDSYKNIEVHINVDVIQFNSNDSNQFESVRIREKTQNEERIIKADGVFIFIGLSPNTKSFKSLIDLSDSGHIITTGLNQTSHPGIFAAGDCRFGAIAQVAAATGEGVVASYGVRQYLTEKKHQEPELET
ncbi:MAG TPA: pyridine nucleotide-disulfide oxidoreductase [Bacteroidetes bacterium]|nr:pyridine nucleotide-disulfide oxidoreductase [Bacteroidota bacterium]